MKPDYSEKNDDLYHLKSSNHLEIPNKYPQKTNPFELQQQIALKDPERLKSFSSSERNLITAKNFLTISPADHIYSKKMKRQGKNIGEDYLKQIKRRTQSLEKREKSIPIKTIPTFQESLQIFKSSICTKKLYFWKMKHFFCFN